jgi:hypothetical protein
MSSVIYIKYIKHDKIDYLSQRRKEQFMIFFKPDATYAVAGLIYFHFP